MFRRLFNKGKEEKCAHEFDVIEKLYTDSRTTYRNQSDGVTAFELKKCKKCDSQLKKVILEKRFPVYMSGEGRRRDEFVRKLKSNGYRDVDDFKLGI